MVVEHPLRGTVYYKFKSVKSLPPKDFVSQFSRDLSRDGFSVENLRWIFDAKKIKAEDLQKLREPLLKLCKKERPTLSQEDLEELVDNLLKNVFIVD